MITVFRNEVKEFKDTGVVLYGELRGRSFYFKKEIYLVEESCSCGQLIENRQELKFKEVTGHCFGCHPRGDFWGDTTRCQTFSNYKDVVSFVETVRKYEMFPRTRIKINLNGKYEGYYSYNRARLFCLIEHEVDIGYPQSTT